jgi:hypothetical protein
MSGAGRGALSGFALSLASIVSVLVERRLATCPMADGGSR